MVQFTNGFSTLDAHLEDLLIQSPDTPKHRKLLTSLDSVLIKTEDRNLPRLRRHSQTTPNKKSSARRQLQKSRQERRILTFSSDEDEDDAAISTVDAQIGYHDDSVSATPTYDAGSEMEPDFDAEDHDHMAKREHSPDVVKKEELEEPPTKRRRGRPRKNEQEKKEKVVTRRSRRIVENPTLRKHHSLEQPALMLMPKPLRAFGLVPGASTGNTPSVSGALLLTQKANGKQKPLVIDAERLHTASSRDKRFNLTTLDVLKQFVDEYTPRATKNDIINEQVVLDEFKAHLIYHLRHLMDLHASVRDISHDIAEVQRRKNETRRKILDLKKKHADVGTELSKVRKDYSDDKQGHAEFMAMASNFAELEAAVKIQPQTTGISEKIQMELDNLSRVLHPREGVAAQLQAINARLASMVENQ